MPQQHMPQSQRMMANPRFDDEVEDEEEEDVDAGRVLGKVLLRVCNV